jgi:glucan phosphoethanolaminetransferase (alkaline phosphatase superfamily)
MNEWAVSLVSFTGMNPTFKGGSVALVGLLALLFAFWMNRRWKEPLKGGFLVFIGVSVFIVLYGLFVLVFQPQWWKLPY